MMKPNILKKFVKIRTALEQERAKLLARLNAIQAALGTEAGPEPASTPEPATTIKPKRKLSPENKAKLIAGIKARWAKYRAEKGVKVDKKAKAPKRKGQMSAAGKARVIAAQKARWAKFRAEKAGKK